MRRLYLCGQVILTAQKRHRGTIARRWGNRFFDVAGGGSGSQKDGKTPKRWNKTKEVKTSGLRAFFLFPCFCHQCTTFSVQRLSSSACPPIIVRLFREFEFASARCSLLGRLELGLMPLNCLNLSFNYCISFGKVTSNYSNWLQRLCNYVTLQITAEKNVTWQWQNYLKKQWITSNLLLVTNYLPSLPSTPSYDPLFIKPVYHHRPSRNPLLGWINCVLDVQNNMALLPNIPCQARPRLKTVPTHNIHKALSPEWLP